MWAELPEYPDGICIDREDGVWIASPVGDRCARVLEGGEVTDVIEFPGRHTIACAIGGEDGHTLFVCTSSTQGEPERSRAERGAALETVTVRVPSGRSEAGVGEGIFRLGRAHGEVLHAELGGEALVADGLEPVGELGAAARHDASRHEHVHPVGPQLAQAAGRSG